MRNNAVRKQMHESIKHTSYLTLAVENDAELRQEIAQQAEEACHLKGNIEPMDFEEFLSQYGKGKASDFA